MRKATAAVSPPREGNRSQTRLHFQILTYLYLFFSYYLLRIVSLTCSSDHQLKDLGKRGMQNNMFKNKKI